MGAKCHGKKLFREHEHTMTEIYSLNKIGHFMKTNHHSNINGMGKRIFYPPETRRISVSKIRSLERPCTLNRVHDGDKPRGKRNPIPQLFSEARNRSCETINRHQLWVGFENAAVVSTQQKESGPWQDEYDSPFFRYDVDSQFISDSELWNTSRIVYPDDNSSKRQSKFLSLADINSPTKTYTSCTITTSPSYTPYPITEVIAGKLYVGSENNAFNEEQLLALGITHVLSVSNSINQIQGIEHQHFVMNDMGRTELDHVLDTVYPFMERAQQAEKKLFVHCTLGQNRSPTVVIAFLMKNKGLTLYEAHKMLRKQRPLVQIHHNYAKMLLSLEKKLYNETSLPDDWMEPDGCCLQTGLPYYKSEDLTSQEQLWFKDSQKLKDI